MQGSIPPISANLRSTPLREWHVGRGARMVDFAGFSMPVQYSSIVAEHMSVRNSAGMFDVSHMGRFLFRGQGAMKWLDRLLTCRLSDLSIGQVRYSLICGEHGGVLDDVLVTRWPDSWGLVVNASNRTRILDLFTSHRVPDATLEDISASTVMVAVQGPDWWRACHGIVPESVASLPYFRGQLADCGGACWRISRTGYTGEDGVEIIAPADVGTALVDSMVQGGAVPCGLGARDTLRLEAGMPLYGHELDENIDPFQAGLVRSVDLDKEFLGRAALIVRKADASLPVRVGIMLEGRRAARQGDEVLDTHGASVGRVTSGTFSPTLERPVAMAYARRDLAGMEVSLKVRDTKLSGTVCPLPFYRRDKARKLP